MCHGWVFPNCPVWLGLKIACLQCVKEDVSDNTGCGPDLLSLRWEVLAWTVPESLGLSSRDASCQAQLFCPVGLSGAGKNH